MKYSYFFDLEKTHRMEMSFIVTKFVTVDDSNISLIFKLLIEEYVDNQLINSKSAYGSFLYDSTDNSFDMDFNRIRLNDKWIFTVTNAKNVLSTISIGLVSTQSIMNPLGEDITSINAGYTAELKGNNLAILEQNYVPPII